MSAIRGRVHVGLEDHQVRDGHLPAGDGRLAPAGTGSCVARIWFLLYGLVN